VEAPTAKVNNEVTNRPSIGALSQ